MRTGLLSKSFGIYSQLRCKNQPALRSLHIKSKKYLQSEDRNSEFEWVFKITYNSYLQKFLPSQGKVSQVRERMLEAEEKATKRLQGYKNFAPLILNQSVRIDRATNTEKKLQQVENPIQFPYEHFTKIDDDLQDKLVSEGEKLQRHGISIGSVLRSNEAEDSISSEKTDGSDDLWLNEFGTEKSNVKASNVPCGGCGAILHCQDKSIPGFLPYERFTDSDLRTVLCQRCYMLIYHQAALEVNVSPEDYVKTIDFIKDQFAAIMLVVDLVDFPCSIWPMMKNIIGSKRPIFLIGNKVDLLPQDSESFLLNVKKSLVQAAVEAGIKEKQIIITSLISATTGYGVEDLISDIQSKWATKGDIYILGCTNVGKSSIFNILLQSDLCKTQVSDIMVRATVSKWPGTTLNLLKFPMLKPVGWRVALRQKRLSLENNTKRLQNELNLVKLKQTRNPKYATLMSYVGKTFIGDQRAEAADKATISKDPFVLSTKPSNKVHNLFRIGDWDEKDPSLAHSKWVYDTPGTIGSNQILDLFTLEELQKILPTDIIMPRSFYVKQRFSLLVGGIFRLDYSEGTAPITYTVFTSQEVPITVCAIDDASNIYEKASGTPVFGVPSGSVERLKRFPELQKQTFSAVGIGNKESCADVVLSALGWVALTVDREQSVTIDAFSPQGKGVHFRSPSLLPDTVKLKGKRIRGTPAYGKHRVFIPR